MRKRMFLCFAVLVIALQPVFVKAAPTTTKPSEAVIAVFNLHGPLKESPADESLPFFGPPEQSLKDVINHMKKAGDDENVKAVVLMSETSWAGFGQTEELRQAIADLKSKGKDVYAHGDFVMF